MRKIYKIDDTEIILEDLNPGAGRIAIINYSSEENYTYSWGAMGRPIGDFISSINNDYLARCLLGSRGVLKFSKDYTFRSLRKFIKEELDLPWYKHLEFQKSMRKAINRFKSYTEDQNQFVYGFDGFIKDLDFYLIEDKYESDRYEREFKNISEPWHFIENECSDEYNRLCKLHNKLKQHINDNKGSTETYREISDIKETSSSC